MLRVCSNHVSRPVQFLLRYSRHHLGEFQANVIEPLRNKMTGDPPRGGANVKNISPFHHQKCFSKFDLGEEAAPLSATVSNGIVVLPFSVVVVDHILLARRNLAFN